MIRFLWLVCLLLTLSVMKAQEISGVVMASGQPLPQANVWVEEVPAGVVTDSLGKFRLALPKEGYYTLKVSYIGFQTYKKRIRCDQKGTSYLNISLAEDEVLDEVVLSANLRPVLRSASAVPVERYTAAFFKMTPTASVFEALQQVNGLRPQVNCSVCNTGDIHINGLEGPYTMVVIDGMPIVSGLSTVYGLSGIPNSLIDRVEVVKGPASSLYGSEAVGGLINIITRDAESAPQWYADSFYTGWGEANLDLAVKAGLGQKVNVLTGLNYFHYDQPRDENGDNFTDLTLQQRISVFQKWTVDRPEQREFHLGGRFFHEDRWGGEMQWNSAYRGGDQVYGESIRTRRWELIGKYQLPLAEPVFFSFSGSTHHQDAAYGTNIYLADQRIGFAQLHWAGTLGKHSVLAGTAFRYTWYDDNSPATAAADGNNPDQVSLPGAFVQGEWALSEKYLLLTGLRWDYNSRHGNILTPRLALRWKPNDFSSLRLNAGTGFRVVNLFTEEHASLTGARQVVIEEELRPEKSYNANLNYLQHVYANSGLKLTIEASGWYTYFTNAIIPDYDSDPQEIKYSNLDGSLTSRGISLNTDWIWPSGLSLNLGATLMDVSQEEEGRTLRPVLTEKYSAVASLSYAYKPLRIKADYTANAYGPMRLPLLGPLDPRPEYSPFRMDHSMQLTYSGVKNLECYAGVKNIFNWTPASATPFLIARASDPFNKLVEYDPQGNVRSTDENPYALTFDPSYVYATNQGRRLFFGLRFTAF